MKKNYLNLILSFFLYFGLTINNIIYFDRFVLPIIKLLANKYDHINAQILSFENDPAGHLGSKIAVKYIINNSEYENRLKTYTYSFTEKDKIKAEAAIALHNKYKEAMDTLTAILEQKDVLAYEIYSGAGEHLRYQMAGGKANDRNPSQALSPEAQKSYKWKFRGEVWEDEVGHYRSSLTNVCPDQIAKNTGGK